MDINFSESALHYADLRTNTLKRTLFSRGLNQNWNTSMNFMPVAQQSLNKHSNLGFYLVPRFAEHRETKR